MLTWAQIAIGILYSGIAHERQPNFRHRKKNRNGGILRLRLAYGRRSNKHIEIISKNISSGIGAVRKLKPHVDHNTLICAYNALVLPLFDYCCEVWDTINLTLCNRLQKLQNRTARIIVGRINEHGQSELALAELNWKALSERRAQFVASQMYKITHDLAPKRLSNIFHETPSSRHYNLRGSSTKLCLNQPKMINKKKF